MAKIPFDFDPEKLQQEQADAQNQRDTYEAVGGIADAMGKVPSLGDIMLNRDPKKTDYAKMGQDYAKGVADPWERRKALMDQYKSVKEMQKSADDEDPASELNATRRSTMKSYLEGVGLDKLASKIGDNTNGESLSMLEKMYPQAMQGQNELANTRQAGQNQLANTRLAQSLEGQNKLAQIAAESNAKRLAPTSLSPEETIKLSANQDALKELQGLRDIIVNRKEDFGGPHGLLSTLNPWNKTSGAYAEKVQAAANKVNAAYNNGNANARLNKDWASKFPSLMTNPEKGLETIDSMIYDINDQNQRHLSALRSRNVDLRGIEMPNQSYALPSTRLPSDNNVDLENSANAAGAAPTQKTVNGRVYTKVNGGWKAL